MQSSGLAGLVLFDQRSYQGRRDGAGRPEFTTTPQTCWLDSAAAPPSTPPRLGVRALQGGLPGSDDRGEPSPLDHVGRTAGLRDLPRVLQSLGEGLELFLPVAVIRRLETWPAARRERDARALCGFPTPPWSLDGLLSTRRRPSTTFHPASPGADTTPPGTGTGGLVAGVPSPAQYLAMNHHFPCKAGLLLLVQSGYPASERESLRNSAACL
jgi:hypothetical protein